MSFLYSTAWTSSSRTRFNYCRVSHIQKFLLDTTKRILIGNIRATKFCRAHKWTKPASKWSYTVCSSYDPFGISHKHLQGQGGHEQVQVDSVSKSHLAHLSWNVVLLSLNKVSIILETCLWPLISFSVTSQWEMRMMSCNASNEQRPLKCAYTRSVYRHFGPCSYAFMWLSIEIQILIRRIPQERKYNFQHELLIPRPCSTA